MAKSCTCCGYPSAKHYSDYNACNMCAPKEPEVCITEAHVNDNGRVRKAKVRELTYRCTSSLCSNKKLLNRSIIVIEWLE